MKCPRRLGGPEEDEIRDNGTCSFCGSLSQEEFFKAVEEGKVLGPTDKNYKVYVDQRQKFYFQHLDAEGRAKFIKLYNEGGLVIGVPGDFYRTPFFCRIVNEVYAAWTCDDAE